MKRKSLAQVFLRSVLLDEGCQLPQAKAGGALRRQSGLYATEIAGGGTALSLAPRALSGCLRRGQRCLSCLEVKSHKAACEAKSAEACRE